ncbi:MAG: D-lyxose/D-mannose family sugar isomerase [Oscillospiraceae bacterium]|nr:D-lyxose/D-mannose family sugar isomerase [Oscillospiraceae bacterium]
MKRSEINQVIRDTEELLRERRIELPPFMKWTPQEWEEKGAECQEIRENQLGWDITDFGCGDFARIGLTALTLRNGNQQEPQRYPKPYAEKLLIAREGQVTPMHFHWYKMEDIINRGGGVLVMQLYCADERERLDREKPVEVVSDGVRLVLPAGGILELEPGQSVTYTQRLYHSFWGKQGGGDVVVGEVSMCNDDATDNRFLDAPGRFPAIEEDEPPYRLLCNEYPEAK